MKMALATVLTGMAASLHTMGTRLPSFSRKRGHSIADTMGGSRSFVLLEEAMVDR